MSAPCLVTGSWGRLSFPLCFAALAVLGSRQLAAQTFVQLTDLGSGIGPRLTRAVAQQRVDRRLFGAIGSKVTFINGAYAFQLATDPDWARVVIGLKDEWVHAFTNIGGPGGNLARPAGIDISAQRRVFIADRAKGRILAGTFDLGVGNITQPMSWSAGANSRPVDVAWDGRTSPLTTSYLYVADDALSTVSYWDVSGSVPVLQWSYGGAGSGAGQFLYPSGVCVGKTIGSNGGTRFTDQFYVVDRGNHRVVALLRYSSPQWWIEISLPGWDPTDCAVDHFGNVYVADQASHRIHKFTPYLNLLASYGTYGTGANNLNTLAWPHAISVPCGLKAVNGQTVWYCEGRVITAERWSDVSGAVEHYLGMSGSIESPVAGDPDAWVNYTATDHAYTSADVYQVGVGVVQTLIGGYLMPSGQLGLYWDGRQADGTVAPDGYYLFRVYLSSAYACPSGATWCWKSLYSSQFWHRYCVPDDGEPPPIPLMASMRSGMNLRPVDPPTCGNGGAYLVAGGGIGVPQAFGVRQLPGAPATLSAGLTSLSAVPNLMPSLSVTGAAVDASATEGAELRRSVRERGLTALQVNLSEPSDVGVEILDLAGRLVWRTEATGQAPGMYVLQWDGSRIEGGLVPPGVYTAVVRAQGQRATSRLVLTAGRSAR